MEDCFSLAWKNQVLVLGERWVESNNAQGTHMYISGVIIPDQPCGFKT